MRLGAKPGGRARGAGGGGCLCSCKLFMVDGAECWCLNGGVDAWLDDSLSIKSCRAIVDTRNGSKPANTKMSCICEMWIDINCEDISSPHTHE